MKKIVSFPAEGLPGNSNNSLSKPRLLIADDDESIRDIFRLILSPENYELDIRSSGEDLLKNKFILPDLFLIDKQLSGVSGTDVCAHLKKQARTKNIPVIMISASPDIARLSKDAGADNYIEKPFDMSTLLKMIQYYIKEKKIKGKASI
jgi:DNA-binding response OmpR family regulator